MQFWPPESIQETMVNWKPVPEVVSKELSDFRGGFFDQMKQRVPTAILYETFLFLIWSFWRAGGLMLIGMALFKWDILTAKRSMNFYRNGFWIGLTVGLSLIIWGLARNFQENFKMEYSFFIGSQFNYWGSLLLSFAFICLIMIASKKDKFNKSANLLAGVGRTAFSNYILQTLICTTIFYGHGFGLFGKVERSEQILIVIAIWIFQILITHIWLQFFRFGPIEWLWRSLTYWKIQPLKL
jgi:uncharacterized protein